MKNKCCICEADSGLDYKKILDYSLLKCKKCGLVYLDEIPSIEDDFIERAKDEVGNKNNKERVEYWSFPGFFKKHKRVFDYYFEERLKRIRQFKPKINSLFDIGCGYGFWLKFCLERGIDARGIDLSDEAINYAKRELNLNVERYSLEDYRFNSAYDVIVMCDILEHLQEPNSQLKKIYQALSGDGVVFIQVPNLLGFKLPPFHGFGLPYHFWQFDISTLGLLLRKNGFKVLEWWTGVMGVIGVYESGGPTFLDSLTWKLARQLKIGNRLMVAAKKI